MGLGTSTGTRAHRSRRTRGLAVTTAVAIVASLTFALGGSAGAATVNYLCNAYDNANQTVLISPDIPIAVEDITVNAPANVDPGETFQIVVPARSQAVPATVIVNETPYDVTYVQASAIRISVFGGAVVLGSAVKTPGTGDPTATTVTNTTNNWLQMVVPTQVAGGGTVEWPEVTFSVTAGADGTQVTTNGAKGVVEVDWLFTAAVLNGATVARVKCTAADTQLSSTDVGTVATTTTTAEETTTTTEEPTTTTAEPTTTTTAAPPLVKPNISIGDAAIVEGSAGKPRHLKFSVTLTENSPLEVTAEYTITDGSATGFKKPDPGIDYRNPGVTKTVKFPVRLSKGTTAVRRVISVPVYPDTDVEGDETLTVTLANPTGGVSLGRAVATGTIIDDDPGSGPALAIGDASLVEGDVDKRVSQLGLTLSEAVTEEILVDYVVVGGTATCAKGVYGNVPPGTDCNDLAGKVRTMRWRPGVASGITPVFKAVAVQIFGDLDDEGDETVTVVLSNVRPADPLSSLVVTLSRSIGTITIVDDD